MELLPYICVFIVLVNDTDSGGNVSLDTSGRTQLSYAVGPNDASFMQKAIGTAAKIHFAAGARKVSTLHVQPHSIGSISEIDGLLRRAQWGPNDVTMFSAHPLGTCRMGQDPRTSVVDEHGMVHGHKGIFVLDGSILPSSLSVNPQVTILAVAQKHAERIADEWITITT
jgi:choline dehydrogenase-like flavoprotein